MLYECDDNNCKIGADHCTNRAFADLKKRCKAGGKYRIGVEVMKTIDRGYGVRANRTFEPNQIVVEYTGEIITQDECDDRMNKRYKDAEVCGIPPFAVYFSVKTMTNMNSVLLSYGLRPIYGARRHPGLYRQIHQPFMRPELPYDKMDRLWQATYGVVCGR